MRALTLLGATGSIGLQTLEVAAGLGLEVAALAANRATPAFADIAAHWQCETSFEPRMAASERATLLEGWDRAVARVRSE